MKIKKLLILLSIILSFLTNANAVNQKRVTHNAKKKNFLSGIASYYGENDGSTDTMANGKEFDPDNLFYAAHPTLPLGTKLLVKNLLNKRTICVEVTDRMPFHKNRVIDLTPKAALYLHMYKRGLSPVQLTIINNKQFRKFKAKLEDRLALNDDE